MSTEETKTLARATLEFSEEQRKLIRNSFANGATETEFGVLMEVARARRLNPLLSQIHFVKRWNQARGSEVWSTQVGIDGLRAIAERTGRYGGQDEPIFEYDNKGALKCCRVRVYRKDIERPFVGIAFFGEYAQTKKDGSLTNMWATKPHVMLSKCAEALGLRKGFPEDMAGLYAPEEMGAEDEREVNPPPPKATTPAQPSLPAPAPPPQSRTEAAKEKVKAKLQVVDVKAGESEAEATARTAKPIGSSTETESMAAMLQLSSLAKRWSFDNKRMWSIIKGATGKTQPESLTLADVSKVEDAIDAVFKGAGLNGEPPPPSDADAPA